MVSVTIEVSDPSTGESFRLTTYKQNGVLVYQRLGEHLFRGGQTPARAAVQERFGRAAMLAKGQRFIGFLPPAAENVKNEFLSYSRPAKVANRLHHQNNQGYYASLLGPDTIKSLEEFFRKVESDTERASSRGRTRQPASP
jgi:hypothetical protein